MNQRRAQGQIKVLVVDDSSFMRKTLSMMLESDNSIKVIGTARDGAEAIEKTSLLKPDLITLDIEMPNMDGLTALRHIMLNNPTPVMMVSSVTSEGAGATLDALELGAVDFIPKQLSYVSLDIFKIKDELLKKIKDIVSRRATIMARLRHKSIMARGLQIKEQRRATVEAIRPQRISAKPNRDHHVSIVTIGCSTGGPPALQAIIPQLPRNFPVGILVVQHMPPSFTKSLAERLDSISELTVKEAADGDSIEAGIVYVAPGGKQMRMRKVGGRSFVTIDDNIEGLMYSPCIDHTLNSVAKYHTSDIIGTILTGMGNNGLNGIGRVKRQGGICIAQDEASCVVYGMPKAVIEADLADHIVPVDAIAGEIAAYF